MEPFLTYAAGPAGDKQRVFAETEEFTEVCALGSMGSGKTRALAMSILFDVINYPGARIALMRSESTLLKKSTLETFFSVLKQAGLREGKEGKEGDYYHYKNDSMIEFYLSDEPSRVYYFGLNTGDYKEKLKSFEPFRAYVDEASEVEEDKVVFSLIRCRQDVLHRFTYEQRIKEMVNSGVLGSMEEGLEHFRVSEGDLGQRQRGKNLIKYVANDEGNNWIWNRMINPYRDKPHPDSDSMSPEQFIDWVHENVGVTEFYITPDEKPRFRVGNIVELQDGRTAEVVALREGYARVNTGGPVETVPTDTLTLVLERYAIYIFSLENHSLSEDNVENFYFANKNLRDQYLHGLTDVKTGRMYPEFSIDTHVIEEQDIPENWFVWVGLDYNIDIATATFIAENPFGDLVIFDEFEGTSGNPQTNAFEILARLDHPWERVKIYYDSNMDNRDPLNPSKTVAQVYRDAGLLGMRTANKNRDYGVQKVKEVLQVKHEPGFKPRPKMFVMNNCTATIYGSDHNKGLINMEWEDWRYKRFDHLDDSRRYAVASRSNVRPEQRKRVRPAAHVPQWGRV